MKTSYRETARPLPVFKLELRQAIRDGRKTHTRGIVNPQPPRSATGVKCELYHPLRVAKNGVEYPAPQQWGFTGEDYDWPCPHGKPGDIAYLREPLWRRSNDSAISQRFARYQDNPEWAVDADLHRLEKVSDDREKAAAQLAASPDWSVGQWTSMTMPRWAARTFVRITDIRVERLQDISEEDAIAEGCTDGGCLHCGNSSWPVACGCVDSTPDHVDAFFWLWQSIHGQDSLDANPWVWVVEWELIATKTECLWMNC